MSWEDILTKTQNLDNADGVAVRYTNDPDADRRRGVSFVDWGIAPESTREACEDAYPDYPAVYDETAGGWLPALPGLCAFHDWDVESAVWKARRWSGSDAYRFVIVATARLVDTCWDGDVVEIDWERACVLPNPDFS